jgi:hypothetical protein
MKNQIATGTGHSSDFRRLVNAIFYDRASGRTSCISDPRLLLTIKVSSYSYYYYYSYFLELKFFDDQLRDQRGQGANYWPPFAPWVQ